MLTRRDFIKVLGAISAAVINPFNKILRWGALEVAVAEEIPGELYAGFVLLSEEASVPSFIQCARAPILGQVDNELDPVVLALRGETIFFDDPMDLINSISFNTYVPSSLPADLKFMQGYLTRFVQSGEEFEARIDFAPTNSRQPLISISARPIFPRPYPIWPVYSADRSKDLTNLGKDNIVVTHAEKVNLAPTPGLMLPTEQGHLLHWIKQDILYTLMVEHDQRREAAEEIVRSLVETSTHR